MSANKNLLDAITAHRIAVLRFESGGVREALASWDALMDPPLESLDKYAAQMRAGRPLTRRQRQRVSRLQRQIADQTRRARSQIQSDLEARLSEASSTEQRLIASRLRSALPTSARERLNAASPAATAALLSDDWTQRIDQTLFDGQRRVQASLARALVTGEGMAAAARRIQQQNSDIQVSRSRLTTIVRTEIQRAANVSAEVSYRANADVLRAVQYLATLDSRTCMVCAPQHNQVYPLTAEGHPGPSLPQHPRCRCFYVPVTKSWRQMGLSDSKDKRELSGRPTLDRSYPDWFTRQSEDQQRSILGPGRYDLWKSGKVSLENLSANGRLLSLGELANQVPAVEAAPAVVDDTPRHSTPLSVGISIKYQDRLRELGLTHEDSPGSAENWSGTEAQWQAVRSMLQQEREGARGGCRGSLTGALRAIEYRAEYSARQAARKARRDARRAAHQDDNYLDVLK